MNPPNMAQAAFFYYNPDQAAENRQHSLFTSQPSILPSNHLQRFQHTLCSSDLSHTLMGDRPSSASSHVMPVHYPIPSQMTPIASPRPLYQKPAMIYTDGRGLALDTDCLDHDGYAYPATPPLSISGSNISSPPMSSGILPTPTNPVFFAENLEGVKEGCEGDVKSEILAGEDWTRAGSPPLTPGKKIRNSKWTKEL
jgi:C2H2 transcription facotor